MSRFLCSIDVAIGEGLPLNISEVIRTVMDDLGFGEFIADCLAAPTQEPNFWINSTDFA